jgi:hypothetical protein
LNPHAGEAAVEALAHLHHAWLLGLQLMIASRRGPQLAGRWSFRLFRRQHHEKFLSSFDKLGLRGLPDAVACARYHALSNEIGGVAVECIEESDRKAWVRFRYPRWMYDGAVICGVPVEVSRGFLEGWYAHNGVSLGNPRLGFVCVSEDMTGEFGLCGYFLEHDRDLSESERLRFAPGELPPPFDPARRPAAPPAQWSRERLLKARRNYAMEYVRNGLSALAAEVGFEDAVALGGLAARLTGMQGWRDSAAAVGARDGGAQCAADYIARMLAGMGDVAGIDDGAGPVQATLRIDGCRIARGLDGVDRDVVLACWTQLWDGAVRAHRPMLRLTERSRDGDRVTWVVDDVAARPPGPASPGH